MGSVFFLLLVTSVYGIEHGWRSGKEYVYEIKSRTLAGLHQVADQYTGVLIKGFLIIQPNSNDNLRARIIEAEFAPIHQSLNGEWNSAIDEETLDFQNFPISDSPFEINLKNGVIIDLLVDKGMPTWELNILRSITSQIQIDVAGENAIGARHRTPEEGRPYDMFSVMEESVSGKCEVVYDITPFFDSTISQRQFLPVPEYKTNENILVTKTKNFSNCEQKMMYHFGFSGRNNFQLGSDENDKFFSRSSISRIILTGKLESFVIQFSETRDEILKRPNIVDTQQGIVGSRVTLTLIKYESVKEPLDLLLNSQSTGSLVYDYNSPFRNKKTPTVKKYNPGEKRANEQDYLQPKPTLQSAPDIPLLPYFIGKSGHFLFDSKLSDQIGSINDLCHEIGKELQNPNQMMEEQTLEKITILTRLIRTMNANQLTIAQDNLYRNKNNIDFKNRNQSSLWNSWAIFRDAVAQAGTGPALLTIKNWIQKGSVQGFEAARIVSVLSKVARTPTPEYMEKFFEIVTMPETRKDPELYKSAVLAFSDLARYTSVLEKSAQSRYPVHVFGSFSPKSKDALFGKYLPYLAVKLKEAVSDGDSPRVQFFTSAIGRIGHPKILQIFEPYLERTKAMSKYQRTWIVLSLNKLASTWPTVARPVLYKIYMNTGEDYQVRCAAVFGLMMAKPPASMLQRMADFTKYDRSKHVSSAVKSAIEDAAELGDNIDLGRRARVALPLLTPRKFSFHYSKNNIKRFNIKNMNYIFDVNYNLLGSDDSILPKQVFGALRATIGGIKIPAFKVGGMVSSLQTLLFALENRWYGSKESEDDCDTTKWTPETISKLLKIEADDPEQLEGNFFFDNKMTAYFLPFDNHTLDKIPAALKKLAKSLKEGLFTNQLSFMSFDLSLSLPTESGLPFTYTLELPTISKVDIESHATEEKKSEKFGLASAATLDTKMKLVHSINMQGRLGFVTPFESRHYITGYDKQLQFYLPVHHIINYDLDKNRYGLKIQPLAKGEKYKLFQLKNIPFTAKLNIPLLKPIEKHESMKIVKENEITSVKFEPGLGITWESDYDKSSRETLYAEEVIKSLKSNFIPWLAEEIKYSKHVFSWTSCVGHEQFLNFSITHEALRNCSKQHGDSRPRKPNAEIPIIVSKESDSHSRRKCLLKESIRSISFGKSDVLDIGAELSSSSKIKVTSSIAYGRSDIDLKSRALFYLRAMFNDEADSVIESYGSLEIRSPRLTSVDTKAVLRPDLMTDFDAKFRMGEDDNNGLLKMYGSIGRSKERHKDLLARKEVQACLKANEEGNDKALITCDAVNALATIYDEMNVSFAFDHTNVGLRYLMVRATEDIRLVFDDADLNMNAISPRHNDDNRVDYNIRITPECALDVVAYNPNMDITIKNIGLEDMNEYITAVKTPRKKVWENQLDEAAMDEKEPVCIVDALSIKTFDNKIYPLDIKECWHVFFTTFPKENPDDPMKKVPIPSYQRTSIVGRGTEDDQREYKIHLGQNEILFHYAESQIKISVNAKNVEVNFDKSFQLQNDGQVMFEIYATTNKSVALKSSKHGIFVEYDGRQIYVQAAEMYRKSIRGLCGDYNGEFENDFETPKRCVRSSAAEFIASWALIRERCNGASLELALNSTKMRCVRAEPRASNVISEIE